MVNQHFGFFVGWLLTFVAVGHRTPRNTILFIWAASSAVVIGLPSLDVITQISAVVGYLGYAGIVIAALRAPTPAVAEGFRLGRARPWIGGAALGYCSAPHGHRHVPTLFGGKTISQERPRQSISNRLSPPVGFAARSTRWPLGV